MTGKTLSPLIRLSLVTTKKLGNFQGVLNIELGINRG